MKCRIFARLETHLTIRFSRKNQIKRIGTAITMLYICLTKRNVDYFDLYTEFKKIVCQPASQPAVRLGSTRCTALEIQHSKGYPVAFTKLLF